jgi:hypothetical protein
VKRRPRQAVCGLAAKVRWAALATLVLAGSFILRAHDIYSSWAETKILADRLELTLTMARSSAHDLLPDARSRPPISPASFAGVEKELRAAALRLLKITSDGKPLPVRTVAVKISGDNDVAFTLSYPQPSTGTLTFSLHYLRELVDGHVATLVISNARGDDLGWTPLTVDQPNFQISVRSEEAAQR